VDGGLSLRQALGVVALVSLLMLNAAFAVPIAYTPASDARPNGRLGRYSVCNGRQMAVSLSSR
jgi:hypothetical protein